MNKIRLSKTERQNQILSAASSLFIQKGFGQASMDELAKLCGISKPVIYENLGSKSDILVKLIESEVGKLREMIETSILGKTDPFEILRQGIRGFFSFVKERKDSWRVFLASSDRPVFEAVGRARELQVELVAQLTSAVFAQSGKEYHKTYPKLLAYAVNGACEALANWWVNSGDNMSVDEISEFAYLVMEPSLKRFL